MLIPALKFDQNIHYQMTRAKTITLAGRQFNIRQVVDWGAISLGHVLRLNQAGNRLYLEAVNYQGVNVTAPLAKRFLRFINLDHELEIPERFLCATAKERLAQDGLKLMLMIKNKEIETGEGRGQVLSNIVSLYVMTEQRTGETYGLLLLNA
jgi:hypothetical protein